MYLFKYNDTQRLGVRGDHFLHVLQYLVVTLSACDSTYKEYSNIEYRMTELWLLFSLNVL